MAKDKKAIVVYADWISIFNKLSDDEAGRLIKHFFGYVNDQNPTAPDRLTDIIFEPIKQQLKRDLKKYEAMCLRNRSNGEKGGRPKQTDKNPNNPVGLNGNPKNPTEPDTDTDTDTDNDKEKESTTIDYGFIISLYHDLCPKMSKVIALNETRKGFVNARISEFGIEKVTEVFRVAGASDFLNGQNDKVWKADFEWLMRPTNFLKVLEGKYNREKPAFMMP